MENNNNVLQVVSLRDQFAMAALPAIIAHHSKSQEYSYKEIAKHTFVVADYILKERGKNTTSRYGKKKK